MAKTAENRWVNGRIWGSVLAATVLLLSAAGPVFAGEVRATPAHQLPKFALNKSSPAPATTSLKAKAKAAPARSVYQRGVEVGVAAYYNRRHTGARTASGLRYDPTKLTAAHKTLPLGSQVRVTNLRNGRSVVVTITDRGPFTPGRILDLSEQAARQIDLLRMGIARVQLTVLKG